MIQDERLDDIDTATHAASVWRNRDFRLVWIGQTLSDFGNSVSQLAYPLLMLALTDSPAAAGALAATRAVPYLVFGLSAGALADRWNRRRVMIACDVCRAVNMATIPLAIALGFISPALLFVTGFLGGMFYVFFSAAESACLPNIVPKEQLTAAVSAQESSSAACGVVAAPVGGALLQVFRGLPFLADAVSFLASAICLSMVRADFRQSAEAKPPAKHRSDVTEGLKWLWNNSSLRLIAITAACLQVAISGIGLVAIVNAQESGTSSVVIGVLFSALGVGGVIGALLAPRLKARLGFGGLLLAVLWIQAFLWVMMAITSNIVLLGAVLAVFAISMPCFGIAALSYQLEVTPDHLRGRVGTAFSLLIWAATPLGGGAAGLLLGVWSSSTVALVFASWVLILSIVSTLAGHLRELANESV